MLPLQEHLPKFWLSISLRQYQHPNLQFLLHRKTDPQKWFNNGWYPGSHSSTSGPRTSVMHGNINTRKQPIMRYSSRIVNFRWQLNFNFILSLLSNRSDQPLFKIQRTSALLTADTTAFVKDFASFTTIEPNPM